MPTSARGLGAAAQHRCGVSIRRDAPSLARSDGAAGSTGCTAAARAGRVFSCWSVGAFDEQTKALQETEPARRKHLTRFQAEHRFARGVTPRRPRRGKRALSVAASTSTRAEAERERVDASGSRAEASENTVVSMAMTITHASSLTDSQLLTEIPRLAGGEREATVALIAHLAEFDARRLFEGEGFPSTFKYCLEVLRLSEDAAFNRSKRRKRRGGFRACSTCSPRARSVRRRRECSAAT